MREIKLLAIILFALVCTVSGQEGWHQQKIQPDNIPLLAVEFADSTVGVVVGAFGYIFRTENAGETWHVSTTKVSEDILFSDVCYVSDHVWFAVGNQGMICRSTDDGDNWTCSVIDEELRFYAVTFPTNDSGVAVGDNGVIVKTTNSGTTWSIDTIGNNEAFFDVAFPTTDTGFVVGTDGRVYGTVDGGLSWEYQQLSTNAWLNSVVFSDTFNGFIVGDQGVIFRTIDRGLTWTKQQSATNASLRSVDFLDNEVGYISGSSGTILATTNGGADWYHQESGTSRVLHGISLFGYNDATAVGDAGTILHTNSATVVSIVDLSSPSKKMHESWTIQDVHVRDNDGSLEIRILSSNAIKLRCRFYGLLGEVLVGEREIETSPGSINYILQLPYTISGLALITITDEQLQRTTLKILP